MAMTQIQLIQSLGRNLEMLETELSYGIAATELRHLIGRIGELYAAMITNGRMALEANQKGYDVVSADGERISVKTTARDSPGTILFNKNTLQYVDRIIILKMNDDDMCVEILLNCSVREAEEKYFGKENQGKLPINLATVLPGRERNNANRYGEMVAVVPFEDYVIKEFKNGSVIVELNGEQQNARQILRTVANKLGLPTTTSSGEYCNTRSLGYRVIKELNGADGAAR